MIKAFVFLASLLMFMVFTMALYSIFFPYEKMSDSMQSVSKLTHMTSLSQSVAYSESPLNATYPDMPSLGRIGFVYEQ